MILGANLLLACSAATVPEGTGSLVSPAPPSGTGSLVSPTPPSGAATVQPPTPEGVQVPAVDGCTNTSITGSVEQLLQDLQTPDSGSSVKTVVPSEAIQPIQPSGMVPPNVFLQLKKCKCRKIMFLIGFLCLSRRRNFKHFRACFEDFHFNSGNFEVAFPFQYRKCWRWSTFLEGGSNLNVQYILFSEKKTLVPPEPVQGAIKETPTGNDIKMLLKSVLAEKQAVPVPITTCTPDQPDCKTGQQPSQKEAPAGPTVKDISVFYWFQKTFKIWAAKFENQRFHEVLLFSPATGGNFCKSVSSFSFPLCFGSITGIQDKKFTNSKLRDPKIFN